MKQMSNGQDSGIDGIPGNVIKLCSASLLLHVSVLVNIFGKRIRSTGLQGCNRSAHNYTNARATVLAVTTTHR